MKEKGNQTRITHPFGDSDVWVKYIKMLLFLNR